MEIDTRNQNTNVKHGLKNDDVMANFLLAASPSAYVYKYYKNSGLSESDADKKTKTYKESFEKITRAVNRFVTAVARKYSHLDEPEIITKAISYAKKHDMSSVETQIFVKFVLKGDVKSAYWPINELKYTEMSKFLGVSNMAYDMQLVSTNDSDKADLSKMVELYEQSRNLHNAVKNQRHLYKDCALEAINAKYDNDKHNISSYIHPVVTALYLNKIDALEKATILTNIGRLIIRRSITLIGKNNSSDYADTNELDSDLVLMMDISRDPQSLKHYGNETPMANLLKRFKIQIELWKNIHNLRQGKVYSKGDFDVEDSITGFLRILNSYQWAYYDSPDMYQIQDEGTVLRKLLATFSIRPTWIQLSAPSLGWDAHNGTWTSGTNLANIGKVSFISTPILNLRLTNSNMGIVGYTVNASSQPLVPGRQQQLKEALEQVDTFWEKQTPSVRSKKVIYSKDILFFYVNRKYQSIDITSNLMNNLRSVPTSVPISGVYTVNTEAIDVEREMTVSNNKAGDRFDLNSVVCVNQPITPGGISSGCFSIIIHDCKEEDGQSKNYRYHPQKAGQYNQRDADNNLTISDPFEIYPTAESSNNDIQTLGTIFVYKKTRDTNPETL